MTHTPAGKGTSCFLSLRPSGLWTQLSRGEQLRPPVLGTLVSLSFRTGAAHTGLGSWGGCSVWGFCGRESLFPKNSAPEGADSGSQTISLSVLWHFSSPRPLQSILEVGLVVEVCLGKGGDGQCPGRSC